MIDLSNKDIAHVKGKDVEYLQFKRLLEYPELVHCYSLSVNEFDVAGNDTMRNKKEVVIESYKKISKELDVNYNHIIRPYQTHTDILYTVKEGTQEINIFRRRL